MEIEIGRIVKLAPTYSNWYKLYVSGCPAEAHGLAKFRSRFRLLRCWNPRRPHEENMQRNL